MATIKIYQCDHCKKKFEEECEINELSIINPAVFGVCSIDMCDECMEIYRGEVEVLYNKMFDGKSE